MHGNRTSPAVSETPTRYLVPGTFGNTHRRWTAKRSETRTVNNHPHMQSFTQHAFVSQLNTDLRDTCSCGSLGASHTVPRDLVPKTQGSGVSYPAPMNKVNTHTICCWGVGKFSHPSDNSHAHIAVPEPLCDPPDEQGSLIGLTSISTL